MKKLTYIVLFLLQMTCITDLIAQNNAMVVYTYDSDGNRISMNYILTRMDNNDAIDDTIKEVTESYLSETDYNISVYPNPTNGYLVLSTDLYNDTQTLYVKLYSMQGNIIKEISTTSNRTEFNLSDYPAGVYFLSVIYNDEQNLWKIVKK